MDPQNPFMNIFDISRPKHGQPAASPGCFSDATTSSFAGPGCPYLICCMSQPATTMRKTKISVGSSKSVEMLTRSRQKPPVTRLLSAGFCRRVLDATSGHVSWILRTLGARPCTLPGKGSTHVCFSRFYLLRVHFNSEPVGGRPAVGRATPAS